MYAVAGSVANDFSSASMNPVKLPSEMTVMLLVISRPCRMARAVTVFVEGFTARGNEGRREGGNE
jgi:hypothetical protein